MKQDKPKRTSLWVAPELWFRWKLVAAREGVSMREHVTRLLEKDLAKKKEKL